jgi:hypothetical protein
MDSRRSDIPELVSRRAAPLFEFVGVLELDQDDVDAIPEDRQLPNGAVLVRPAGYPQIYLVDHQVFVGGPSVSFATSGTRWVASPEAMDSYGLSWERVYVVPPILVWSLPMLPRGIYAL